MNTSDSAGFRFRIERDGETLTIAGPRPRDTWHEVDGALWRREF
jgi:hypothetical protein